MKQKPTGRTCSMPMGLAWGAVTSMIITILGTAILAKLVDREILPEEKIGYGIMLMLMLASYMGGKIAWNKIQRQRLITCLWVGGIYFAILLSITALFFGGQYESVAVTGLLILGGVGVAALPAGKNGRGGKRRKIRIPAR